MFTHVIFDLDGTLLNTIDDLADAGNHVCAAHGWPTHTVDQFKHMVGNGIPNLVKRFAPDGLGEDGLAGALAEFSAYYGAHKEDKTAPYPGVPELLSALKGQGVRMAVLSNKAHALAGPVVEHYFPGVFEYVQGALPDAPLKPDPALLFQLMEQLGAKPETTLFVGDSDVDVLTGKNGGLTVAGVLWGFRDREELEDAGADCVIERPEELLNPGKKLLRQAELAPLLTAGCVLAWLAAAFFALSETLNIAWFFKLLQEVFRYGFDEAAGYNLYLAEDFWISKLAVALGGIPLLLLLALAVHLTRKLPKRKRLTVGCAVCWPLAVVLVFPVWRLASGFSGQPSDLVDHSYEPYIAENIREGMIYMALFGAELLLALALAIYCTVKLRKRGKNREHPAPDKR